MIQETINKLIQIKFFKILFFVFLFFIFSKTSFASSRIYFTVPADELAPSSEFVVSVMLDTTDPINAVDIELKYDPKIIKFLDFNNAGSIIDFWQSAPSITESGNIKLSGGILNGFNGKSGLVLKIYFKASSIGNDKISFIKKDIYLADGKGTLVTPETNPLILSIKNNVPKITLEAEQKEYKKDDTPPEILLTLVKNPKDNTSLIVFNVKDSESGVKSTQIRFKKWFSYSPWQDAVNPVLYPRGVWVIELKVENNASLESVGVLKIPTKIVFRFVLMLLFLILLVFFVISRYNKYKRLV